MEWLIKNVNGKIQGPFSEEEICNGIENFEFSGDEYISKYPSYNQWKNISSHPPFYDALFKVLSPTKVNKDKVTSSVERVKLKTNRETSSKKNERLEMQQETSSLEEESLKTTQGSTTKKGTKTSGTKSKFRTVRIKKEFPQEDSSVIDMENVQSVIFKRIIKKLIFPIIIVVSFLGLILFFLHSQDNSASLSGEKVRLLIPRSHQPKSSQTETLERIKRGMVYYLNDQVSKYLKAQNEFLRAIEGDHKNKFAMAYLCLTYFELWPFTHQDSRSIHAISSVVRKIESVDQGGVYSALCRSVHLLTQDQFEQAESLIKTSIDELSTNQNPENISPFFYYLRGHVNIHQLKYNQALQDLDYAKTLLPNMLSAYTLSAQVLEKQNRLNEALKFYSDILKKNPLHKTAILGQGILMYNYLGQYAKGDKIIREALELTDVVLPSYLASSYFILAQVALKINDSEEFLKYGKKAYSLDPTNKELQKLIQKSGFSKAKQEQFKKTKVKSRLLIEKGNQLAREGSQFEARNYYEKAFQVDGEKNSIAAVKMATSLWESGLSSEAIEWLQRAVVADPKFIRPYILMSDYYSQLYEVDKAVRALKIANKKSPNNLDVFKGYAFLHLKRNSFNSAITYANKALEVYESDVDSYIILSKAYYFLGDFNDSLKMASKAREIDSNNKKAQIQYAIALGKLHGEDASFDYFEGLISKTQPGSQSYIEYVLGLSQFLYNNDQFSSALNTLSSISNLKEKPLKYHLLLGKIYSQEDTNINLAHEEFLQAALINPSDPEVMYELSQLLMKFRQYDKAESYLQKILNSYPRYPKAHYFIARILVRKGGSNNLNLALERVRAESQINPHLPEAHQLAGDIYETLRKYTLCAQSFQKVIEILPHDSESYVRSAICYRKSGDLDLALQILKGIAETSKDQKVSNPKVYRELGAIYETKKEYTNATKSYAIYLDMLPNAKDKKQIEERVKRFGD